MKSIFNSGDDRARALFFPPVFAEIILIGVGPLSIRNTRSNSIGNEPRKWLKGTQELSSEHLHINSCTSSISKAIEGLTPQLYEPVQPYRTRVIHWGGQHFYNKGPSVNSCNEPTTARSETSSIVDGMKRTAQLISDETQCCRFCFHFPH